ncbi:hypothetical protein Q4511_16085 [Paracoccus sp. 1_MG-2023]|uniref:hypothetical protein n=1 Tax=unclassified Paracoccus (in: a-proteobacteria) TaxID=2688777 RepID=UPI001C0A3ADF|nr:MULTISPECIES: hypothetical protein [unclassified Paracoccus (in: a-proteobacteria)]MBU2956806.1 hypothetical protein [Paracoccus sp. C2R09]MDO6670434.1 hypothetical protein [Paracoccus sp. 1_MG-2023]
MPVLDKLKTMLRSDDLLPSLSIFPAIDHAKIRKDLELDAEGAKRGARNLPASETTTPDHIEASIVSRIEESRRSGLENFENNRQVYNERLARAGALRKEVEIVAGKASGDYQAAVRGWKMVMTTSTERLYETYQHREVFRERHALSRPAKHFEGWVKFVATTIIFVAIEAGLNMFMFSSGNEQGMAGGLLTATIFSAVNVAISLLFGVWACGLNHSNFVRKFLGLLSFVFWIAFALLINLTIAHFRDLIDSGVDWGAAVRQALPAMSADPLGLSSMDSLFLVLIGGLISTLAFIKGWHAFDPFPGYSRVERDLAAARAHHAREFEEAFHELTDKRDDAIDELRDADQEVRDGISQAIDALYGHSTLNAHLRTFLDQCDTKLAYLLAVYRDANVAARSELAPPSFTHSHRFSSFDIGVPADDARRQNAEAEAEKVTSTVERAIAEIFANFSSAIDEFQLPEEIQQGALRRSAVANTSIGGMS